MVIRSSVNRENIRNFTCVSTEIFRIGFIETFTLIVFRTAYLKHKELSCMYFRNFAKDYKIGRNKTLVPSGLRKVAKK